MAFDGLIQFIGKLQEEGEISTISTFADPLLEIAEITDRVNSNGGKALLFVNNGTTFPLLINMFGSEKRMCLSIGRRDLDEAGRELVSLFSKMNRPGATLKDKLAMIPGLASLASLAPVKRRRKGKCQEVVINDPDLGILPVLKCWPHDGGPFITLPVVHTRNPETGEVNAGMYRMQVFDSKTTGMHWHRHKTGASHYEAWKRRGELMPVAVSLGGDPVYTYSATAPLPEGIDEYLLAGFLRKKRVKMVKCLTQDIFVPEDSDIVIEGFVDPSEDLVWEGPFGDHTGFYSLADWYPKFHVTCITHRIDAVYPATIVGIPPKEDAVIGKATERLFLYPIKLTLQPDITDIHMPPPGVAHNLVLVRIDKKYPGQGLKVISSLFGAGQMMFSKFIIVLDNDTNLYDYREVAGRVIKNTGLPGDLMITRGPLDVLDHSSDSFSFGGKMGIDATTKLPEEVGSMVNIVKKGADQETRLSQISKIGGIANHHFIAVENGGILFVCLENQTLTDQSTFDILQSTGASWVFILDKGVDPSDSYLTAWQVLSNTDPGRDILFKEGTVIIDSRAKLGDSFPRKWPNIVLSSDETIMKVDRRWNELGLGPIIISPSVTTRPLLFKGNDEAERS